MESKRRQKNSIFTTSLSEESELFYLSEKLMSEVQRNKLDSIRKKNKDFSDYYEIKELLLEEAKEPLTTINKTDIQSSLSLQTVSTLKTNSKIKPNKLFSNQNMLKLLGILSLLKLYNIDFDYSEKLHKLKIQKQNDYNEIIEKLSDKQLMLRWNTNNTY